MSIPTHNLYDFIYQATEKQFNLFYFYPFGSKRLEDISSHYDICQRKFPISNEWINAKSNNNVCYKIMPIYVDKINLQNPQDYHPYIMRFNPIIICNDQEPLHFDFYENDINHIDFIKQRSHNRCEYEITKTKNLRWACSHNFHKKFILLHSECYGENLQKYKNTGHYELAYWWSHAYIALDWYRFAEYDTDINSNAQKSKKFLLYARDFTGSRKYRQNFINLLSPDSVNCTQIGSFFQTTNSSELSAEYNFYDHNKTDISVVLETVFDDRVHLTEKTLRPIAVGHPFILVAGARSLAYLKSYGFKTFSPFINEDYDNQVDSNKRMHMIINELHRISNLSTEEFSKLTLHCKNIAEHNKKLFFSDKFREQIKKELVTNVSLAQQKCNNQLDVNHIWEHIKFRKKQNLNFFKDNPEYTYILLFLKHLKKGGTLEDYVPPDLD